MICRRSENRQAVRAGLHPRGNIGQEYEEPYLVRSSIQQQYDGSGKVKFFNTEKGFGFIAPDQGGPDVFVFNSGTREDRYENDTVTFEVEHPQNGLSAINVVKP